MKNQNRYTISADKGAHGMDLYIKIGGAAHYIATRRPNKLLFDKLKTGVSLGELRRFKPQKNSRAVQRQYRSTQYLLKVVDDFLKYDMAA